MRKKQKKLPIGIDNFQKIIDGDYYYVDKTLMVKELLDKGGEVCLFTRPRRFGKSLNISMLQYYFENLKAGAAHLFDGLRISKAGTEYASHQNQYPVIKLSFKGTGKSDFKDAFEKLREIISDEYKRHAYLLDENTLETQWQDEYRCFLHKEATVNQYASSLKFLSDCLEKHYEKKVVILIDEYDVPLEKAHFNGYYEEMAEFIRSLFEDALKTNDSLAFGVITGCLRVSKESIFTGLNNLNIVSILSDSFGEYFGFTEREIEKLLADYGLEEKRNEMRDWYNGYLFGETVVYNPWSSVKYLYDIIYGKIDFPNPHWSNTSSNAIIRQLIAHADEEAKDEIELLIQGGSITKPIHEDIVYADISKNMVNLWNFLYFTGYLKKVSQQQIGIHSYFELTIPNKEIQYIYERQIREWFAERVQLEDMTVLYEAVLNGGVSDFEEEVIRLLGESISYMDSHENFYHGFLVGVLRGIKGYRVFSNREAGNGRSDIFLMPRDLRKPAVIIEIKVADKVQKLENSCESALLQIKEKQYVVELKQEGYSKIINYGIAFYRKMCQVKMNVS